MADLPDSFSGALQLGQDSADAAKSILRQNNVPGFIADPLSAYVGLIPMLGGLIFASVLALMKDIIVPTAVAMLQVISQLRQDGAHELATVTGAVMGEFLGFEVPADQLAGGVGVEANIARAKTLGGALHDLLTHEFGGDSPVTPESGAAAARTFSGYNMNFAAQNAVIGLMFDMFTLHEAEQIRELGVEVAQNLGLGRMHRQAMKPLIDNLIAKPYDKFMRAKYRQDSLNEQQLVEAYLSGLLQREELDTALAHKGYPAQLIEILLVFYAPRISVQEADALIRTGALTEVDAINALKRNGWTDDFARLKLSALRAQHVLRLEDKHVNELISLVKERYLSPEQFALELRKLHYTDDEVTGILSITGTYLENQYRHFTLAEVLYMVDHNIITQQDVDDWAASIGFNEKDRVTLSLFFAEKELEYEASVAAKRAAAAKKAAAAAPKTPPPPATTTT